MSFTARTRNDPGNGTATAPPPRDPVALREMLALPSPIAL